MTAVTAPIQTGSRALAPADKMRQQLGALSDAMVQITGDKEFPQRAIQLLILAANGNPDLYKCTEASLADAMLKAASWGLDIGDGVHIVPYNVNVASKGAAKVWEKRAQAIPDYRGLMTLAKDGHGVRDFLPPRLVRRGDDFRYQLGLDEMLHHIPADDAKRGEIVGAYVVAVMPFGYRTFSYMSIADIEAIRAKSKSWGPETVRECPPWYALKTVVRNFCSKMPKRSKKLSAALTQDEDNIPDGEILPATGSIDSPDDVRALGAGASEVDANAISDAQHDLLTNLLKSHVITDLERAKVWKRTTTKAEATQAIDWLKTEVPARKAAEKSANETGDDA